MMLTPVPAAKLDDVWEFVRAGLVDTIAKTEETRWKPVTVYRDLVAGSAALFLVGQQDGFVICRRDESASGPILFIWVLWGRNLWDEGDDLMDELDKLALSVGASETWMESPRKAWARLPYFDAVATVYRRKVKL